MSSRLEEGAMMERYRQINNELARKLDMHASTSERRRVALADYKRQVASERSLCHFIIEQHVKEMARELFAIRNRRSWK